MVERAFAKFGKFLIKARYFILLFWIVLAIVMHFAAPSMSDVGTTDESSFLPAGSESTQVRHLLTEKYPAQEDVKGSGVIVFYRPDGLNEQDMEYVQQVDAWLMSDQKPEHVSAVMSIFTRPDRKTSLTSEDGTALLTQVSFNEDSFSKQLEGDIAGIRGYLAERPGGLEAYSSGSASISTDLLKTVDKSVSQTTVATVILVLVLLLLIYRSPVAPLVPLTIIGMAYVVSSGILGFLAQSGWKISTAVSSIMVVLVFGAGTDYCLFMLSRFREELAAREDTRFEGGTREAVIATAGSISTVIIASATTVIIGFMGLAVATYGMIKTMGPSLALAIGVTLLAGLTLTPALMAILGDKMFWPFHARIFAEPKKKRFSWEKLAAYVTRNAKIVAPVLIILLLIPCIWLLKFRQSFDVLSQLPKSQESVQGFEVLSDHFNQGDMNPVDLVFLTSGAADMSKAVQASRLLATELPGMEGVAGVISLVNPQGTFDGSPYDASYMLSRSVSNASQLTLAPADPAVTASFVDPITTYLQELGEAYPEVKSKPEYTEAIATLAGLKEGSVDTSAGFKSVAADLDTLAGYAKQQNMYVYPQALSAYNKDLQALEGAFVSPDKTTVHSYLILNTDPYAVKSMENIRNLRSAAVALLAEHGLDSVQVQLGGETAKNADVQTSVNNDFLKVMLIVLLGVMLVFMVLLRSLIAPLYLMATVILSFGATMGIETIIFQDVLGQNGILYMIPILLFVLLIALGADYNIFLSSRIREESAKVGILEGIRVASSKTGGIITTCGIILAGTFATQIFAPLQMLAQVGVAVTIGILLDTFVVRAILVPAIATLVGRWNWWPSKLGRQQVAAGRHPMAIEVEPAPAAGKASEEE